MCFKPLKHGGPETDFDHNIMNLFDNDESMLISLWSQV